MKWPNDAVTHSEGTHARVSGLGGLAGGSGGTLVLGISALVGGGLGSLRHDVRVWEKGAEEKR